VVTVKDSQHRRFRRRSRVSKMDSMDWLHVSDVSWTELIRIRLVLHEGRRRPRPTGGAEIRSGEPPRSLAKSNSERQLGRWFQQHKVGQIVEGQGFSYPLTFGAFLNWGRKNHASAFAITQIEDLSQHKTKKC